MTTAWNVDPPRAGENARVATRAAARMTKTLPSSEPELDRLMSRYAAGDSAAFVALYGQLAPRLGMFLLRLAGGARAADDLLQETFLRIHRARGTFANGAAVVPWCYAIARNVYIDHARKRKERAAGTTLDGSPELPEPAAAPAASPDAELTAKQTLDVVRATLAALPVTHREAFVLLRFEGLSVADAAQVLDTSEANVKVRAFRAYQAFRSALKDAEDA